MNADPVAFTTTPNRHDRRAEAAAERRYRSPKATAEYMGDCSVGWLARMRLTGDGPPYIKVGAKVLYDLDDVDDWLQQRRISSTSEAAAA